MEFKVKSLEHTKKLAQIFCQSLNKNGLFVTLIGDIGAGKTQFVRYVLEELNVCEKVTSPSFVILNEYKTSKFPVYHFDLYRLEKKGLQSMVSELREYSKDGNLTFIEWAEFAHDEIPDNALMVKVEYDEDDIDIRYFKFIDKNNSNQTFLNNFYKRLNDEHFNNLLRAE